LHGISGTAAGTALLGPSVQPSKPIPLGTDGYARGYAHDTASYSRIRWGPSVQPSKPIPLGTDGYARGYAHDTASYSRIRWGLCGLGLQTRFSTSWQGACWSWCCCPSRLRYVGVSWPRNEDVS